MRQPGKLPPILSREDVQRVIAHTANLKHRTMIQTTYAAGLRLNEVLHLRVTDLDAARLAPFRARGGAGRPGTAVPPSSGNISSLNFVVRVHFRKGEGS